MMTRLLYIPLLLLPLVGQTQVYKSLDADGRPVYTDRPIENSTKLDVPLGADAAPNSVPSSSPDWPADSGFLGSYSSFEIVSPEDNATLRNPERELRLSLLLTPPLQEGHRLRVQVDGVDVEGDLGKRTQLRLTGLALGSHRVQAQVIDDAGTPVAATSLINVHIRPPLAEGAPP
jgi:hypothetical protein